jgi:replicative DNA helicase
MSMTAPSIAKPTDFNDLKIIRGASSVREAVDAAQPAVAPAEWPEPSIPGVDDTPVIPADVLPVWAATFVQAVSRSTQTPPALAVMACLGVLSTVLQRRYEVAPWGDSYTEPLSIWCLSASPSGTRKTAILNALLGPLVHWEKLQRDRMRADIARVNAQRAVAKKRIEKLLADSAKAKDAEERRRIEAEIQHEEDAMPDELRAPRLFTGDVNAEKLQALMVDHEERMGVHSDEPGIFAVMAGLYTGGQANIDAFLQGHAGSPMRVDRMNRSVHVDRPALAVNLMVQPDILNEVAGSRRFRGSGLLARFLFAMPASTVGRRDVRQHITLTAEQRADYERRIMWLLEGMPAPAAAPRVLPFDAQAREIWLDLADEIERAQADGGRLESIRDWCSKLPGAAARIAGIFELATVGLDAPHVSADSMGRAVRLARLLIPHAMAAFGALGADDVDVDARAVLRWIQSGGLDEFTRREAQKAQEGRFRTVDRLAKAMQRLEAMDVVREVKRHNKGAPPTTAYIVNPKVHLSTLASLS